MMRSVIVILALVLVFASGCHRSRVQLTIIYDKNNETSYPYASYGDAAKIYYTIGVKNFDTTVANHKRITISVPPRTQLRATVQKITSDVNGINSSMVDFFFTADHNHPTWTL
jgi:hypothetical protein